MTATRCCVTALLFVSATTCSAATLHGRVKDQQCSVLSRVSVRIQAMRGSITQPARSFVTDEGGNYNADLAPGSYRMCVQREGAAPHCEDLEMPATGDKWITTQLRDAAPDLSNIGNHAY